MDAFVIHNYFFAFRAPDVGITSVRESHAPSSRKHRRPHNGK
jgi:hypothetical protein